MADPTMLSTSSDESATGAAPSMTSPPQLAMLDFFFPGFSMFASVVQKYLHVDLNLYIPLLLSAGMLTVCWNYFSSYVWDQLETHFMSVVDIRTDDEIYNILMAWVASQRFSQGARRFVVNTNLSSRSWIIWRWDDDDDDDFDGDDSRSSDKKKKKALSYTPAFGSHYFWYKGRLLLFRRTANREQNSYMLVSEKEEISISCFGRNPWVLKELLMEAQQKYIEKDECKTQIYRGTVKSMSNEATWQRCMSRASRPFSTVILNEKTKQELVDDVSDYLCPATQRWYANRGIPYRRGYLLHGPPGTGKSSLSLALAGYFKMRIYIVSLSSNNANEETLGALFAELPRRCVVLLEDIDTAGLTHTRDENGKSKQSDSNGTESGEGDRDNDSSSSSNSGNNNNSSNNTNNTNGRLSLSGLLNILDGVASQEGRVLIMTTNHIEKLDKALIRPGRVDMIVEFGLADKYMTTNIFKNIFAYLEGDDGPTPADLANLSLDERDAAMEKKEKARAAHDAKIDTLAENFALRIPSHEFSPAELQGHLMKFKRDPEKAVEGSEEFVAKTRKEHKDKQLKAAEDKRKAEEEKEKEAKKKAEEEKKVAEEESRKKVEEEIRKKVEEEIQKQYGDEIKKKVEEEMKKAAVESQKASEGSATTTEAPSAEATSGSSQPSSNNTGPIQSPTSEPGEKLTLADVPAITTLMKEAETKACVDEKDSGYATPSSGEP